VTTRDRVEAAMPKFCVDADAFHKEFNATVIAFFQQNL
jgi:hypothetical protein